VCAWLMAVARSRRGACLRKFLLLNQGYSTQLRDFFRLQFVNRRNLAQVILVSDATANCIGSVITPILNIKLNIKY
jgi:hypothetical protein